MKPITEDDVCFRGHKQTTQGLPVWDGSQARRPHRPRHEGTRREARPQRPLPMQIRAVVSSAAACTGVVFDGANRKHYQRW